jgi:hypothetical protein
MIVANMNHFEEIIDKMMIEGFSPEFQERIMSLPSHDKRLAILSLLDRDRNLFMKIKSYISSDKLTKMDHIKDVILMLRKYVKVGEVEKKKFGEVMTPLELVKEMMATLPEEVWSNPNLKWLDPANGTGPYPTWVIFKLMRGLEKWEPNEEKRYKHIVENMIYVCELQPKNMFLYMCVVDPWDIYKLNIYTGSFLSEGFDKHMKEVWNTDKFDIIIGNPPYNDNQNSNGKRGGGTSLWDKFVNKYFTILNENGFICNVHPNGWRGLGKHASIGNLMKSKQILYLEIHDAQDGMRIFGAGTKYDWYTLQNCNAFKETKIKDQDGKMNTIDISKLPFIPSGMFEEIISLISNDDNDRINLLHSYSKYESRKTWMKNINTDGYKYPCVMQVSTKNEISSLWWSSTNKNGMFGIPKVISGSMASGVIIDIEGKYGLTQHCFAIVDEVENLENIQKALCNPKFIKLSSMMSMVTKDRYDRNTLKVLKKDFWKKFI